MEQTPEPENDNSPAKADRDHIDAFATQEPSKSDAVEYITFDMLVENNKITIQKQSQQEIIDQKKGFYRFEDTPKVSVLCTPVQGFIPTRRTKLQSIRDVNAMKDFLTVSQFPFYRWMGAESILKPP